MLSASACLSEERVHLGEDEPGLDTSLMARFRDSRQDGDFRALYARTRSDLLIWITALARGRSFALEPQDLLQDTFVNIYLYAGSFRDEQPASFRVWSRRIAMNVVRRAHPKRREVSLPEGHCEPVDRRSGPSESASGSEDVRALARAWLILLGHYIAVVGTMRDRDRVALELIEVRGLTYSQAARRLEVGPSNMKMIVFRARKRIRAEVARRLAGPRVVERSQSLGCDLPRADPHRIGHAPPALRR